MFSCRTFLSQMTAGVAGGGTLGALRVVVFSTHTPEQINCLLDAMKTIVQACGEMSNCDHNYDPT